MRQYLLQWNGPDTRDGLNTREYNQDNCQHYLTISRRTQECVILILSIFFIDSNDRPLFNC